MAVPSSGQVSLRGIRREIGTNNYSSSTNYTNISLEDMSEGVNGTINTNSSSRPNGTNPHKMSEFRGYDHDAVANITMTLYIDDYIASSNSYVRVNVDGTLYEAVNGANNTFTISVPASTSISLQAYSEDVSNQSYNPTVELYDDYSFTETDTSPSQAYVSASYTTPSSNFNMYAVGY